MHRVARWGASHETPSALEPASYARAGEARLVERDLGEDAFVVTFHERKRELRRVVVVEAVRRVHPVPGVVVRLEFVGLDEQPVHAARDAASRAANRTLTAAGSGAVSCAGVGGVGGENGASACGGPWCIRVPPPVISAMPSMPSRAMPASAAVFGGGISHALSGC